MPSLDVNPHQHQTGSGGMRMWHSYTGCFSIVLQKRFQALLGLGAGRGLPIHPYSASLYMHSGSFVVLLFCDPICILFRSSLAYIWSKVKPTYWWLWMEISALTMHTCPISSYKARGGLSYKLSWKCNNSPFIMLDSGNFLLFQKLCWHICHMPTDNHTHAYVHNRGRAESF